MSLNYFAFQKHLMMRPFQMDAGMFLPNEMFVDVLCCVDYRTLVFAKLSQERFRILIMKWAAQLAHRRRFVVSIYTSSLVYTDWTNYGVRMPLITTISYEAGNLQSLTGACRELEGVISTHELCRLAFNDHAWHMPGVAALFEAAPSLKYTTWVELHRPESKITSGDCAAFMRNIDGIKKLSLYFIYADVQWALLSAESARRLRLRQTAARSRFVEELVLGYIALPRPRRGDSLELDFTYNVSPSAFGQRIIEVSSREKRGTLD